MTWKDVLSAALALPPEERVELIEALEASLEEGAIDPAVLDEAERRLAAYRAGGPSLDGADVLGALTARFAAR